MPPPEANAPPRGPERSKNTLKATTRAWRGEAPATDLHIPRMETHQMIELYVPTAL